ncbi:LCCL domain protein [Ceratobasidium sp. AG-Ba]|nr:LCCL domain protein [Ceratobasidium sp. AG-Ba]
MFTNPYSNSKRSHSTSGQEIRIAHLESGTPVDGVELEHIPQLTTSAETEPDLLEASKRSNSEDTKSSVKQPQPLSVWNACLLRLLNKHPKARRCYEWLNGPTPPTRLRPTPKLDSTTVHWRTRVFKIELSLESRWSGYTNILQRRWLLILFGIVYIIGLAFISRENSFMTPRDSFIGCTSTYWLKDDGCGLNGQLCAPFTGPDFQFRCPGNCLSVTLANPRTVGAEQVIYSTLVVGGGDSNRTYRGDSWICPAAIQAGVISSRTGGCGTLRLVGNYTNFLPTDANGIRRLELSWPLYGHSELCSRIQRRMHRNPSSSSSPGSKLYFLVVALCWFLAYITFQRYSFLSTRSIRRIWHLSPCSFVGYAFWRSAWRFTLPAFEPMPLERAVWYLAPFWAGVHFNILTAKIPVDRLVGSDLGRPGAVTALVIVVVVLAILIANQLRVIRRTGLLFRYISLYVVAGLVAAILASLPSLTFRLHHGVAKFGFDSILQTAAELRRDAPLGSSLPSFVTNSSAVIPSSFGNATIAWNAISAELTNSEGWNGFSLLVDDVQRLAGQALSYSLAELQTGIPHFFRLAYQRDGQSGDYTKSAVLFPNGTWIDPLPGPS